MVNKEEIKRIIEGVVGGMGISFDEISVSDEDGGRTSFVIKTQESGLLIGGKGENIFALNHIIKRIAGKGKTEETGFDFYVDVNDYRKKLLDDLKNKAGMLAERARSLKVNVELDPMSSYERMIIHTYFEGVSDIETESVGLGRNRRVIIKYVGE